MEGIYMKLNKMLLWAFALIMVVMMTGCKKATPPLLKEIGPAETKAGQGFNVQPGGVSAIWTKAENATITTVIVWGETQLHTTFGSPNGLTALVPKELYSKPGQFHLYLLDTKNGNQSNSLVFTVEP